MLITALTYVNSLLINVSSLQNVTHLVLINYTS